MWKNRALFYYMRQVCRQTDGRSISAALLKWVNHSHRHFYWRSFNVARLASIKVLWTFQYCKSLTSVERLYIPSCLAYVKQENCCTKERPLAVRPTDGRSDRPTGRPTGRVSLYAAVVGLVDWPTGRRSEWIASLASKRAALHTAELSAQSPSVLVVRGASWQ